MPAVPVSVPAGPSSESWLNPSSQAVPSSPALCWATQRSSTVRRGGEGFLLFQREPRSVGIHAAAQGRDGAARGPRLAAGAEVLAVLTHLAGVVEGAVIPLQPGAPRGRVGFGLAACSCVPKAHVLTVRCPRGLAESCCSPE